MKRKMTKQQAEQEFKQNILPEIRKEEYNGKDTLKRAQQWGFLLIPFAVMA